MEYEFTLFIDIDANHQARATKDRTELFGSDYFLVSEATGKTLREWLDRGVERAPEPIPAPVVVEAEPGGLRRPTRKPATTAASVEVIAPAPAPAATPAPAPVAAPTSAPATTEARRDTPRPTPEREISVETILRWWPPREGVDGRAGAPGKAVTGPVDYILWGNHPQATEYVLMLEQACETKEPITIEWQAAGERNGREQRRVSAVSPISGGGVIPPDPVSEEPAY